jgi:NHLM bacteriocin system ABC transporter ATP-binding protein
MLKSLPTPPQLIKGNTPLLLQNDQIVWLVQSGSLALFATRIDECHQPQGNRRYLFTVSAGEALFGLPLEISGTSQSRGVLAVALEETELQPIAIADFLTADSSALSHIYLIETWVQHWNDWLNRQSLKETLKQPPLAGKRIQTTADRYLSLMKQESVQAQRNSVCWIKIASGIVCWMDIAALALDSASPVFPLTVDTWLTADSPAELELVPLADMIATEGWLAGLSQFHRYLSYTLDTLEQAAIETEFSRFQERERLNQQVATSALTELMSPLEPAQAIFFEEGSPLLVATGAVGRALGILIRPPAASEDFSRLKDPLDAIARASRCRTRRVQLVGNWWKKEHGSLLAYTEAGEPVALLQERGDRYVLFDPIRLSRTPVDQALAQTLSEEAYMFYRPLPETIKHTFEVVLFAIRGRVKDTILIVVIGALVSLIGMLVPQATAILINNAIPNGDRAMVWQLGLALFAASFGRTALGITQAIYSLRVEMAADSALQPAIWDRLLQLPPAFFRKYVTGDLLVRAMAVSQIRGILSSATQQTLLNAVFSLLNLGLMMTYSVKLTLVAVGITIIAVIISSISSLLLVRKIRQQEELHGQINGLNIQLISSAAKLRVAVAEERAFGAWSKLFTRKTRLTASTQQLSDGISVVSEALPILSSVLIFWFAMTSLQAPGKESQPDFSIGTFLAFNAAFGTFLGGVIGLSTTATDLLQIVPLWERAKPILEEKPETDLSKTDPGRLMGAVHLDHVTFQYREDGGLILDDVSLSVAPGEFVAIVGASGSGKSTLFRLLLAFETLLSGAVFYDGQDLAGLDVGAVRRQLGVVLQNGRIGAGSIIDNITSGALVSLDEVWETAEMAGFAADIRQMPMGMYTMVNEGGTNLSGGQRQRLLIARAIVLKPKIILLDEATSALDNRTQAIVANSLDRLSATRIVIAHRLSTIRTADRIYVMEAGRVVQVGQFDELLNQPGLFANLAARQLD